MHSAFFRSPKKRISSRFFRGNREIRNITHFLFTEIVEQGNRQHQQESITINKDYIWNLNLNQSISSSSLKGQHPQFQRRYLDKSKLILLMIIIIIIMDIYNKNRSVLAKFVRVCLYSGFGELKSNLHTIIYRKETFKIWSHQWYEICTIPMKWCVTWQVKKMVIVFFSENNSKQFV